MVSLATFEKLGYSKKKINEWVSQGFVHIEDEMVRIINDDVYYEIMQLVLFKHPDLFDAFINETTYESLKKNFIFLKWILDGNNLEEKRPLMCEILRDKKFLEEYEDILLFVAIIEEYELSDLYIPEEDNELVSSYIKVFKKYLLGFNYPMAKEMLEIILKIHDCLEYQVMNKILEKKPDNIKYILKDGIYPSDVTNDNLKKMERQAICHLELGNTVQFVSIINQLNFIYQNQDRNPFQVMVMMVNIFNNLKINKRMVSARSFLSFHGKFTPVLLALLSCNDYYRVQELIDEEIRKSKRFDVYLAIIYILIKQIMLVNEKNEQVINEEMLVCNVTGKDVLPRNTFLTQIDGNLLKQLEERQRNMEDKNINYYKRYQIRLQEGKYHDAKINLLRFVKNIRSVGIYPNFEYLFAELDYLMDNDKELKKDAFIKQAEALKLMDEGNYDEAIKILIEWRNTLNFFHPRLYALLAKCYYKKGDLEMALSLYKEAEEYYLYPEDYEDIIEILYKLGHLEEIPSYYEKREEYDYASLRVMYIMSIVELRNKRYKKARKLLKEAESRNLEMYGVSPNYTWEYKVIDDMSKGTSTKEYTEDDYIEYGIIEDDEEVIKLIEEYQKEYHNDYLKMLFINIQNVKLPLKDKISYILTVIRVLKTRKQKISDEIYQYVDYLITLDGLSEDERKRFTVMKKNYQNL